MAALFPWPFFWACLPSPHFTMAARFTFICGSDDFLVSRLGQERWTALTAGIADDFGIDVIDGRSGNVDEVEMAVNRFISAVQTLPMFGDRKAVW